MSTSVGNLDEHIIALINVTQIGVVTDDKRSDDKLLISLSKNGIINVIDLFGDKLFDDADFRAVCATYNDSDQVVRVPKHFTRLNHVRLWIYHLRRQLSMNTFDIANYDATVFTYSNFYQFTRDFYSGKFTHMDFVDYVSIDTQEWIDETARTLVAEKGYYYPLDDLLPIAVDPFFDKELHFIRSTYPSDSNEILIPPQNCSTYRCSSDSNEILIPPHLDKRKLDHSDFTIREFKNNFKTNNDDDFVSSAVDTFTDGEVMDMVRSTNNSNDASDKSNNAGVDVHSNEEEIDNDDRNHDDDDNNSINMGTDVPNLSVHLRKLLAVANLGTVTNDKTTDIILIVLEQNGSRRPSPDM